MATTTGGLLTAQQMMTLAGLAATAETELPSGESVGDQELRIQSGINAQLAMTSLATGGDWQAVWVGLTQDRANLAYIASNLRTAEEYAVVLRGTMFSSLVDLAEDLEVETLVPFPQGGTPPPPAQLGSISRGAMLAFTKTTEAVYQPGASGGLAGTTLLQALTSLVQGGVGAPTIYVTGHSLGGATATTVALWLNAQALRPAPVIQVYTFAGPTAGDADFASWFDAVFPAAAASGNSSFCVWNQYDAVPYGWADLSSVTSFYPSPPGPPAPLAVKVIVYGLMELAGGNDYTQPTRQLPLNSSFKVLQPYGTVTDPFDQWTMQAAFQHQNNTYLELLGAPQLPALVPTVTSIAPDEGREGTPVTITGTNFTSDCVVDFGAELGKDFELVSDTSIAIKSPLVLGTVDVTVTNMFGTSATSSADQFRGRLLS
jgi:Lipase (class 3)/IPT/TIG domain